MSIKQSTEPSDRSFCLGVVSDNEEPWSVTLRLNGRSTFFCIDAGAEVTVISKKIYTKIGSPELKTLDKALKGPGGDQLVCKGRFVGYLRKGDLTIREEIYVIKDLHKSLLGRPAIRGLNLLKRVNSVKEKQAVLDQFSTVFEGLGKLEGDYTIKLQDNTKPFAVTTPQRASIPLLEPVRKELDHMEKIGVISLIQEPID